MAYYKFTGGSVTYYPLLGISAVPGFVYDLDPNVIAGLDSNWVATSGPTTVVSNPTVLGVGEQIGDLSATYARVFGVPAATGVAATDTAAIQAALNAANAAGGGVVKLQPSTTTYQTNTELVVYSNTEIDARGCSVNLTGSAGRLLRNNAGFSSGLRTVADAAMTSGSTTLTSATAAFTSADVGRSVNIAGAGTTAQLNARIVTYTNATTVTLDTPARSTVSGAAMTVYAVDSNITLWGGTWSRDTDTGLHLLNFHHIDGVRVMDASLSTPNGKYGTVFADATRFQALRLNNVTHSDGVHVQGPASFGLIDTIMGACGDDFVAVGCRDYVELSPGGGNIHDVTVRNITPNNTSKNACHLFVGSNGVQMRNVTVEGVKGSCGANGVALAEDTTNANTTGTNADGIIFRDVTCTVGDGYALAVLSGAGMGNITVDGLAVNQSTGTVNGVLAQASATVLGLLVKNLEMNSSQNHSGVQLTAGATVAQLVVDGVVATLDPAGSNGRVLNLGGSPTKLIVSNVSQTKGASVIFANTTAAVDAQLSNWTCDHVSFPVNINAAAAWTVDASNLAINNPYEMFNLGVTGASLDLQIVNYRGVSAPLLHRSATQTMRVTGSTDATAQLDLTTLTPQDGDLIHNTNATPGCGVGKVVYNAAAGKWKNLYSGLTN